MSELKNYLMDDLKDTNKYVARFTRSGLTKFPPLIISCAITGQNQGKESNPNLPETLEEQVQQTYDAYNAGASLVHIHRRDPENIAYATHKPELYIEVNKRIREKCPDLIINNTVIGGKWKVNGQEYPQLLTAVSASPEVGSVDITNYSTRIIRKRRPAPLTGRDNDIWEEIQYSINSEELDTTLTLMKKYGVKPEFEIFDIGDMIYLRDLIVAGKVTGPHWVQMVFSSMFTYQTPEMLMTVIRHLPKNSILGIVATGACQFPFLTMAMILGCHVRVGMEDGFFIEKGKLAESNAQLVEKIVRIAKELERPIATPAQAREILGLGAPRSY